MRVTQCQAELKYVGTLRSAKIEITFYQGGIVFPLSLGKTTVTKPGNIDLV